MSNDEGREAVGVLKKEGKIRMDDVIRTDQIIFSDLATYYFANKEFRKNPRKTTTSRSSTVFLYHDGVRGSPSVSGPWRLSTGSRHLIWKIQPAPSIGL